MGTTFPLDNTDYSAEALGAWTAARTRGVLSLENNFRVTADGSMTITVSPGIAWLKMADDWGVYHKEPATRTFTISPSQAVGNAKIAVCVRLDKMANTCDLMLRYPETNTPLSPIRDEFYDEVFVALIDVNPTQTSIIQQQITDVRGNENLCGLVRDGIERIPTEMLQEQASQILGKIQAELESLNAGTETMLKTVYDTNNDGIVDDAERLGGELPEHYAKAGAPRELHDATSFFSNAVSVSEAVYLEHSTGLIEIYARVRVPEITETGTTQIGRLPIGLRPLYARRFVCDIHGTTSGSTTSSVGIYDDGTISYFIPSTAMGTGTPKGMPWVRFSALFFCVKE